MSRERQSDFWAMTCYFNPAGYETRLRNYRVFRRHLDVPLVAVELSSDSSFDLGPADADVLVQIECPHVLWQKERLLNVAFQHVPQSCKSVAWFDCDVVYRTEAWEERVLEALDRYPIVQAYRELHDLGRGVVPEDDPDLAERQPRGSLAWKLASGEVSMDVLGVTGTAHRLGFSAGHVWAARREVLERHGFYDARILGGGDKVMFCAAYGKIEESVAAYSMNQAQREHYVDWASAYDSELRGRVGYVDASICHLWHGDVKDRGYKTRHRDFERFDFDPVADIAIDAQGAWRWASDKPELHDYLVRYMHSRREDGSTTAFDEPAG